METFGKSSIDPPVLPLLCLFFLFFCFHTHAPNVSIFVVNASMQVCLFVRPRPLLHTQTRIRGLSISAYHRARPKPRHHTAVHLFPSSSMIFDRIGAVAARVLSSTRASTASHLAVARTDLLAGASTSSLATTSATSTPFGARGITVNVERGDAERAYKRLRRIMLSEGIYKDLRASCEGHKKPSQLRVLARKERERRNFRSKINSRLGWIMRRKERGF